MKKVIYLFVTAMLISGCMTRSSIKDIAREKLGFVSYTNVKYEEKADTSAVDLFLEDTTPGKPYDVIGEINGQVDNAENIKSMLEFKTRQVGGDGVMNITIQVGTRTEGGGTYFIDKIAHSGPEVIRTNDVKAKIIKYK
ncbi:MAG: hypothetical protein NT079_04295 [Candidatus Omnitrophica bacterium]|nr:hypothetical protein [Candidatus Omnitrophota bacterium]